MDHLDSPVHWDAGFCGGAWIVTAYDDVATALRDPRFSVRRAARWINSAVAGSAQQDDMTAFKRIFARSLLFLDGRAHQRLRSIVNVGFKPSDLQLHAPAIAAIAGQLLDQQLARAQGGEVRFDFIAAIARPLPALVIARLMGITLDRPEAFVDAAADLAGFIGTPTPSPQQAVRAQRALSHMQGFFREEMARRGAQVGDDLLGRILQAQQRREMSANEALAQCCTLLLAGYETTRNLLGNGVLALLRHPQQWAALQAQPQSLRTAIREMLRYDSPVQYTGRRLLQDVQLGGHQLRRGQLAVLHIGAANHDARRFSAPTQFDIMRDQGNHLAFGHGPHVCLGAALSVLEAEIVLQALMHTLPALRLLPPGPQWETNPAYRALAQLPVACQLS